VISKQDSREHYSSCDRHGDGPEEALTPARVAYVGGVHAKKTGNEGTAQRQLSSLTLQSYLQRKEYGCDHCED